MHWTRIFLPLWKLQNLSFYTRRVLALCHPIQRDQRSRSLQQGYSEGADSGGCCQTFCGDRFCFPRFVDLDDPLSDTYYGALTTPLPPLWRHLGRQHHCKFGASRCLRSLILCCCVLLSVRIEWWYRIFHLKVAYLIFLPFHESRYYSFKYYLMVNRRWNVIIFCSYKNMIVIMRNGFLQSDTWMFTYQWYVKSASGEKLERQTLSYGVKILSADICTRWWVY